MEMWLGSLLGGLFLLIVSIALAIVNKRITLGTILTFILFVISTYNAIRLKPKS